MRGPTTGNDTSQDGGSLPLRFEASLIQPLMVSTLLSTVMIASVSGTKNSSSRASVMTVTASPRRPHSIFSALIISGQVVTTIVTAQISDGMKGLSTQRLPPTSAVSATIVITDRVRSKSWRGDAVWPGVTEAVGLYWPDCEG